MDIIGSCLESWKRWSGGGGDVDYGEMLDGR